MPQEPLLLRVVCMIPSCILAFDPGVTGAFAIYWPEEPAALICDDIPTANGEVDLFTLTRVLAGHMQPSENPLAAVESVHAMPKQGVSSTFKFGAAYGGIRGVLAGLSVPTTLVAPTSWKRHHGIPTGSDKEASRALALRLFPGTDYFSRKKDHGRAEAALIALYAAHKLYGFGEAA